jgi:hypothetical protein
MRLMDIDALADRRRRGSHFYWSRIAFPHAIKKMAFASVSG